MARQEPITSRQLEDVLSQLEGRFDEPREARLRHGARAGTRMSQRTRMSQGTDAGMSQGTAQGTRMSQGTNVGTTLGTNVGTSAGMTTRLARQRLASQGIEREEIISLTTTETIDTPSSMIPQVSEERYPSMMDISNDGAAYEDDSTQIDQSAMGQAEERSNMQPLKDLRMNPMCRSSPTPLDRDQPSTSRAHAPVREINPPRMTTEEIFEKMANSITDVLRKFAEQNEARKREGSLAHGIPYTYSGEDYEDPLWFINRIIEFFHRTGIQDHYEQIEILGKQLRGRAKRWFEANVRLTANFDVLMDYFLDRFNSPEEVAHVLERLYGDKQMSNEPVAAFIAKKQRMAERVTPTASFTTMASIVINQVEPEIRSRLRGIPFQNFEDLIKTATKIEADLEEVRNTTRTRGAGYQRTPVPTPRNNQQGPASPCRYCREWHYHSDCPQNPYRSGNAGAAAREARDQPPVHREEPRSQTNNRRINENHPQQENAGTSRQVNSSSPRTRN